MCNIVTEFYLYSIVYIYLINSRLDVTISVRHHFRTTYKLYQSQQFYKACYTLDTYYLFPKEHLHTIAWDLGLFFGLKYRHSDKCSNRWYYCFEFMFVLLTICPNPPCWPLLLHLICPVIDPKSASILFGANLLMV